MKISVTNLGPIKDATVELGGLTIFVGPNGTGKSYLAKVIYGLQIERAIRGNINFAENFYNLLFDKDPSTIEEALVLLKKLTPYSLKKAIPKWANLHAELFTKQLSEYFNDDTNLFENTKITYEDFLEMPEEYLQESINGFFSKFNGLGINLKNSNSDPKLTPGQMILIIWWGFFRQFNDGEAFYFPAARSNFMLTYKAIYRARADEHVGLESISDNLLVASKGNQTRKTGNLIRFDRPTEDFLSLLYDLDSSKKAPLADSAVKLERLLYGKERLLVEQPEGALPDFRYQVKNKSKNKIRLHLTSSMVTETSSLLIGLKHWIETNSIVIIDEPESHLHPEAQRNLINVLAEAVNNGLKVILITHSPYILSCVNNLIKFGKLKTNFPNDENLNKLSKKNPDLVSLEKKVNAYHFDRDGSVNSIVLDSGLIDEAEFTDPFDQINDLYETMRDIEWEHRS